MSIKADKKDLNKDDNESRPFYRSLLLAMLYRNIVDIFNIFLDLISGLREPN